MGYRMAWVRAMAVVVVGCGVAACSSDDASTTPTPAGGSTSSSSGGSSGTSSSGGVTPPAQSLYDRLGKKSGIAAAVSEVVKAELADPEIASYFVLVGKSGHPANATQIEECLVNQLGSAAGGPPAEVKYPTTVSGGFTCRDMKAAHADLGIPRGTFDKFVMIAAAKLKELKVADADIATIGTVLNGEKTNVVTDSSRESGPFNKGDK